MPEATVLYSVTGVVIAGLVAWVVMVLKNAKEPWVRPPPAELPAGEEEPAATKGEADDTAPATPVALSEGHAKAAEEKAAEENAEAKAEEKVEAKAEERAETEEEAEKEAEKKAL